MVIGSAGDRLIIMWTEMTGYENADVFAVTIGDVPTGIAVDGFTVDLQGNRIRVTWKVRDESAVTSLRLRRQGSTAVTENNVPVDHEGLYVYEDTDVAPHERYTYVLEVQYRDGQLSLFGPVTVEMPGVPGEPLDMEVLPNPFGNGATIHLSAKVEAVRVFGIDGRLVATLQTRLSASGTTEAYWDGRDSVGRDARPGVYVVRAETTTGRKERQIIRLR